MVNLRPTRCIVPPSYVWLASHFASDVSTLELSGGRNTTCRDIEERPVWDGSSLRDAVRVPEYIRYRQRRKEGPALRDMYYCNSLSNLAIWREWLTSGARTLLSEILRVDHSPLT